MVNNTIAVYDKYFLYYHGISSVITDAFGQDLNIIHCVNTDLNEPNTIAYPVDLILFNVPIFMPFRSVRQLVKKIKERHHEASIILYSAESRSDLAKSVDYLDIKGSFLLEDSLDDIINEIGKVLTKEGNLKYKMNEG